MGIGRGGKRPGAGRIKGSKGKGVSLATFKKAVALNIAINKLAVQEALKIIERAKKVAPTATQEVV
jgi:hypothetical protein